MLDSDLRDQFHDSGVVRLDGALTSEHAGAIRDTVWRHVERRSTARRDDPSTWSILDHAISFQPLKGKVVFAPLVSSPDVHRALDAIFGADGWQPPRIPRAQILLTFPTTGPWVLPSAWHMDCGFEQPTWPVSAVKLFSFFDDVEPEGGGTLLLAGSHRVVERYATSLPPGTGGSKVTWGRFMRHDPWLQRLHRGGTVDDPGRELLDTSHDVDGTPVRAVELTGRPGDVVITHLHVFHCSAPNVRPRPRQMLATAIQARSRPV